MNNKNSDFFDLTQFYNLDEEGLLKNENAKNVDDLTEMLGYDFFDEETNLRLRERQKENIGEDEENIENKSLAKVSSEINLQNKIDAQSERENDLDVLKDSVLNFEGVNLDNIRDFLETQTGKIATIEMIMGNNQLVDKIGMILAVGKDFLLLKETQTGNILVCPLKNIEFIRLNY